MVHKKSTRESPMRSLDYSPDGIRNEQGSRRSAFWVAVKELEISCHDMGIASI